MSRMITRLGSLLACLVTGSMASATTYLNIGDPAPALSGAKWLKGQPVSRFEKGKVYVVEFWATWCGPCKANIPHLTSLAKKYRGRVSVNGISIWEATDPTQTSYMAKVARFVKSEGAKMDYNVAVDRPGNATANQWMTAAGMSGIPASFIVGGDGKIAWIGYPLGLDGALTKILNGTFDVVAARSQRDHDLKDVRPIQEAMKTEHYHEAIQLIDQAVLAKPDMARAYAYDRMVALFHVDDAKAIAESRKLIDDANKEIGAYRMICSILATQPGLTHKSYLFGKQLDEEAIALDQMKYMFLAMGADIDTFLGDKKAAAAIQAEAVAVAEKDPHAPADFVESMRKKLAELRKG